MLDPNAVAFTIARLKTEGWHYERDLLALVAPYLMADVLQTIQVLLAAGCIRAAGGDARRRYRWI